ncbi:MAG TPA: cation:proton antiporter [Xanthobacteraceae bacterium]
MLDGDGFKGLLIFLAAAGIIVPLFQRARIGAVLSFLLVGVVLGPYGLGHLAAAHPWLSYVTFDDPARAQPLAQLGIVFLLFLLGLELSLRRLWELRRYVLGVGAVQMAATTLAVGLLVGAAGVPPPGGVVLGLCLALSSTAVAMELLAEQHRAASPLGRVALSVLLFQDLMVVPILFIVGVLARETESPPLALVSIFVQALAAVALIMVAGRYLVCPLLRSAARGGSRDLIMAITLLVVLGISALTAASGLSAALGAFLAGLLLSESEYRHHIEVDLEPFKGLLLGIFFVMVGTSIDIRLVLASLHHVLLALAALIAVKAVILFGAARAFGVARAPAAELALLLAQASEFAFVVIGLALGHRLLSPQVATSAVAVVALSMFATPLLAMLARRLADRLAAFDHAEHAPGAAAAQLEDHVIIGGFGRVGQTVARLLDAENVPYVALDADGALVTRQRRDGRMVFFGDASRPEMLERAGARRARGYVVTLDAPEAALRMVEAARRLRPEAFVLARAKDAAHAATLAGAGAIDVIPEAIEASLQLGGRLLSQLGLPDDAVIQRINAAREEARDRLDRPAQPTPAPQAAGGDP